MIQPIFLASRQRESRWRIIEPWDQRNKTIIEVNDVLDWIDTILADLRRNLWYSEMRVCTHTDNWAFLPRLYYLAGCMQHINLLLVFCARKPRIKTHRTKRACGRHFPGLPLLLWGAQFLVALTKPLAPWCAHRPVCVSIHRHMGEEVHREVLSQMLPGDSSLLCHCILLQLRKMCFCTVGWKLLWILALWKGALPLQHWKLT